MIEDSNEKPVRHRDLLTSASNAWSREGYNVYKVMAEDFGLKKPWEEKGRPY